MELPAKQVFVNRLIVLIPECLAGSSDLAHMVYWMADRANLTVLYVVVVDDDLNRLPVSRSMATMKAVTSANRLLVESILTDPGSLLHTLQHISCPGDIVVCNEEQTAVDGVFKTLPVSEVLANHLSSPIRTISGFYPPSQAKTKKWSHEVFALAGFLVIIAVFTWLQIELDEAFTGYLQTIFVLGTLFIEMGALWTWNKLVFDR